MATVPFTAVDWSPNEVITKSKLDQMVFNSQWLMEHTPRARFVRADGKNVETDIYVVGGRVSIPKNLKGQTSSATVSFGPAFAEGSKPHVATGIVSQPRRKIFCTVQGLGGERVPDHRGFMIDVFVVDGAKRTVDGSKKKIPVVDKDFFLSFHAVGFARKTI